MNSKCKCKCNCVSTRLRGVGDFSNPRFRRIESPAPLMSGARPLTSGFGDTSLPSSVKTSCNCSNADRHQAAATQYRAEISMKYGDPSRDISCATPSQEKARHRYALKRRLIPLKYLPTVQLGPGSHPSAGQPECHEGFVFPQPTICGYKPLWYCPVGKFELTNCPSGTEMEWTCAIAQAVFIANTIVQNILDLLEFMGHQNDAGRKKFWKLNSDVLYMDAEPNCSLDNWFGPYSIASFEAVRSAFRSMILGYRGKNPSPVTFHCSQDMAAQVDPDANISAVKNCKEEGTSGVASGATLRDEFNAPHLFFVQVGT